MKAIAQGAVVVFVGAIAGALGARIVAAVWPYPPAVDVEEEKRRRLARVRAGYESTK